MQYAAKDGVSRASRKYNKSQSYIYFWRNRRNGTVESLAFRLMRRLELLKRPKPYEQIQHPGQCIQIGVKVVPKLCRENPEQCPFYKRSLTKRRNSSVFATSSFAFIRLVITEASAFQRWNAAITRIKSDCMIHITFAHLPISPNSLQFTSGVPIIALYARGIGVLL